MSGYRFRIDCKAVLNIHQQADEHPTGTSAPYATPSILSSRFTVSSSSSTDEASSVTR